MNTRYGTKRIWQTLILITVTLFAGLTQAAGLLTPCNSGLPALEIRDHMVDVVIEDGYAITTVEQVFVNPHDIDLEAQYSFPVPAHGTVVERVDRWPAGYR
ncbi:VIT domain-containing protein [Pseudomonadota bacterium]